MPLLAAVLDREFRRAIAAAVAVVPQFHSVVGGILGDLGLERRAEGDLQSVLGRVSLEGGADRLTRVADAVEAAVAGRRILPPLEPGQVELPVLGVESAAHDAALELESEGHQRGLGGAADGIHAQYLVKAYCVKTFTFCLSLAKICPTRLSN